MGNGISGDEYMTEISLTLLFEVGKNTLFFYKT
jgi:hypothetical protein